MTTEPVSQAARDWLAEDIWLSIPEYLHKSIEAAAARFEHQIRSEAGGEGEYAELYSAWNRVSDALDDIPGGMHSELEDAASTLWCLFDKGNPHTALTASREPAQAGEITDAMARKVLFDFRKRDGLTCYAHADNEAKDIRNMKAALAALSPPSNATTKGQEG